MNPSQDIQTTFIQTSDGLVAQNKYARILIAPLTGNILFDDNVLTESTECNCLVRSFDQEPITLYINDQPADTQGFIFENQTLWGRLTTGNHPGHIHFRIETNNSLLLQATINIHPSHLDYETDYRLMRTDLERISREIVYLLPDQTRIATNLISNDGSHLDFHQILALHFNQLFRSLQAILKRPDRRLTAIQLTRTIDQSPGRDPNALVELSRTPKFWTPTSGTNVPPHLPITDTIGCTHLCETHRYSDINTPLNRHLVTKLHHLSRRARSLLHTRLGQQLHTRLNHYRHQFAVPLTQQNEPLPLHIDVRYQTAFTLIQDLSRALSPCIDGPFELSYRDTPTLYEYWTWFTLVQTLCTLGFTPPDNNPLFHLTNRGLSVSPTQGKASAITLQKDHCQIRCLYNPTYTTTSGRALTHDLRPDIVLEVQTSQNRNRVHAFDAKYRREQHNNIWIPMREDIDKMHAYRDAIGQVTPNNFQRTLQSAIVLFPAPSDPTYQTHPFYTSLPHGIGGLPLFPSEPKTLSALKRYITQYILK